MKVITIGRDPNCNVVINDPQISRRHAILRISDLGKIEVVDMSSNGTSVNGNPLRKNVPYHISRKDQVTFAGVSKLNWDDIPNPVRLYKWIGIVNKANRLLEIPVFQSKEQFKSIRISKKRN